MGQQRTERRFRRGGLAPAAGGGGTGPSSAALEPHGGLGLAGDQPGAGDGARGAARSSRSPAAGRAWTRVAECRGHRGQTATPVRAASRPSARDASCHRPGQAGPGKSPGVRPGSARGSRQGSGRGSGPGSARGSGRGSRRGQPGVRPGVSPGTAPPPAHLPQPHSHFRFCFLIRNAGREPDEQPRGPARREGAGSQAAGQAKGCHLRRHGNGRP